jgi:hypothetical protein
MVLLKVFAAAAITESLAFAASAPSPSPAPVAHLVFDGCAALCYLDGFNTSCSERIQWVMAQENEKNTCKQSRAEVMKGCPVCEQCSESSVCDRIADMEKAKVAAAEAENAKMAQAAIAAGAPAACTNFCSLDGFNTSCLERIEWMMVNGNQTCEQGFAEVTKGCSICKQCPGSGVCKYFAHTTPPPMTEAFVVGDPVEVLDDESKLHCAHITAVKSGDTYEVILSRTRVLMTKEVDQIRPKRFAPRCDIPFTQDYTKTASILNGIVVSPLSGLGLVVASISIASAIVLVRTMGAARDARRDSLMSVGME